jgi:hypothetical protein
MCKINEIPLGATSILKRCLENRIKCHKNKMLLFLGARQLSCCRVDLRVLLNPDGGLSLELSGTGDRRSI